MSTTAPNEGKVVRADVTVVLDVTASSAAKHENPTVYGCGRRRLARRLSITANVFGS